MDHITCGPFLPSRTTALHAHGDERLASGFGVAAADPESAPSSAGIAQAVTMILEISNRLMHRARQPHPAIARAGPDQARHGD